MTDTGLYGCTSEPCAEEVSYPEDMLRADPTTGTPWCEFCWPEQQECENEDAEWSDLAPWKSSQTLEIERLTAAIAKLKARQAMEADNG